MTQPIAKWTWLNLASGGHVELHNAGPIKIILYIKLRFELSLYYRKTYFN